MLSRNDPRLFLPAAVRPSGQVVILVVVVVAGGGTFL